LLESFEKQSKVNSLCNPAVSLINRERETVIDDVGNINDDDVEDKNNEVSSVPSTQSKENVGLLVETYLQYKRVFDWNEWTQHAIRCQKSEVYFSGGQITYGEIQSNKTMKELSATTSSISERINKRRKKES